jgi:hypothetical protein
MKTAALFFSGLVLSAIVAGPAAAEPVRVKLTARVMQVADDGNVLAGKVVVGQRVNGTYVYNTATPDLEPAPGFGSYRPYANEARMRFAVGSHVFENVQPTQGIEILVSPGEFGSGEFSMTSMENKPLANGALVDNIWLNFRGSGNINQTDALANVAPNLSDYYDREIMLSGSANGNFFSVYAYIEVAELIVADAIVVSPASGSFAQNQQFDAAVILPKTGTVSNAHAMANGMLLPLTYPGSCQLQPAIGAGKPSLLCPGADNVLSIAGGAPIEWTVEMTNGTIFNATVNWDRAQ